MTVEMMVDRPDGFRPRRRRPEGWLEQAIADGSVADPAFGPQREQVYSEDVQVIRVPVGTVEGD